MNKTSTDITALVSQLTLEEKAQLCTGADFWHTVAIERLNIPSILLSDGPYGLRKQVAVADHLGLNEAIKAVCFPAGCLTAASFDPQIMQKMGQSIGQECQAEGVSVILGPAMNIKRSPLCGRNFEYFSEDPYLTSKMAGSFIKGVQSKGVGTSAKHFLANNQENNRMSWSSDVDERTLREIYLAAFEGAIKEAKPWTVMCSYNKINGVYAAENKEYLTKVLREEWGFDGFVVSDWGAVNDRVKDLEAGLELEMPYSGGSTTQEIIDAVKNGLLQESVLDTACRRLLTIAFKAEENRDLKAVLNLEEDHEVATQIAQESIVLLKNEDNILPLKKECKVALIGKYAAAPRYQGGGSSHINSFKVISALDYLKNRAEVEYAKGFDDEDIIDEALFEEAIAKAKNCEVALLFFGLPYSAESEGYDRTHINLPNCQNELVKRIWKVQKNIVVVLHNGSPVALPWLDSVKGVVEAYLGGEGVGEAVSKVLYGDVNPSGKLPETFPKQLEDNPSYLFYGGNFGHVEYREGVFVGYRYYESKNEEVLFPFGHGLSYTTFSYSNLKLDKEKMKDTEILQVSVEITNTGSLKGKEVVQLYVESINCEVLRPVKELRAFEKVELKPGETKTVTFTLREREFAYWDVRLHDWLVPSGQYKVLVGSSVKDIRVSKLIEVECTKKIKTFYTLDSTLFDMESDEKALSVLTPMLSSLMKAFSSGDNDSSAITQEMCMAMVRYMPLRNLMSFCQIPKKAILEILSQLNL